MSCKACECVVGELYTLLGGVCTDCGTPANSKSCVTQYVGIVDNVHWFRKTKPIKCLGCGITITSHHIKCEYGDRDLELEEFFGINQEHWIGR